jgi:cysteine synthase
MQYANSYNKDFSPNISNFIGYTPLIKLRLILPESTAAVYVKLEEFNAGGSIKARVAQAMIADAEVRGILRPFSGQTIIEPTGGNLGIGLAMIAAIRGYKTILVIPDNFSLEKQQTLQKFGAKIILSDSSTGNVSHIHKAHEIVAAHPEYVYLDQFTNFANPKVHFITTGAEIVNALHQVDYFVASIGSGGTITGVGMRIKEQFAYAKVIAVQPEGCDILKGKVIAHKIQATGLGIIAPFLQVDAIDGCIDVRYEQCLTMQQMLAEKEGIFVGISSAANIYAACFLASTLPKEKVIVTVAPDSGKSYL